jgi:hypothetical protein
MSPEIQNHAQKSAQKYLTYNRFWRYTPTEDKDQTRSMQ